MQRFIMQSFILSLAAILALISASFAHDVTAGSLKIGQPWMRATPKGAAVGGGYLKITNTGIASDRLIGGTSEASKKLEFHNMTMSGNVMKMRPMPNGIVIKPGETVELKPGGMHIMLVGLKQPLVEGTHIKGTLVFEKAGTVDVEYEVGKIAAQSSGSMNSHPDSHTGAPMGNMNH